MKRIVASLLMFSVVVVSKALAAEDNIGVVGQEGVEAMLRAQQPYIAKARATYPKAKGRYLAGLPPGYRFMVRKRLTEPGTHQTQGVIIEVTSIKDGKIHGRIADSNLPSFRNGQRISFPESEMQDWIILHPDRSTEGDFIGKYIEKNRSAYTNDLMLSSGDLAKIKRTCRRFIGVAFQDADLWMELAPYIRYESDLYQPMTSCNREYCSGGLRLRDDSEFLYSFLHVTPKGKKDTGDITPDAGRKGNNRFVGVTLIRHGKTIFSEGHIDRESLDRYLHHRGTPK